MKQDLTNKLPTAEEFVDKQAFSNYKFKDDLFDFMREFAKLHVTAALKAAAERGEAWCYMEGNAPEFGIDKNSILTAYPENLIQ